MPRSFSSYKLFIVKTGGKKSRNLPIPDDICTRSFIKLKKQPNVNY